MGPVEYLVVEFPGNKFNGDIVPALTELTENGTIHIIDLVFIKKDADGNVAWFELDTGRRRHFVRVERPERR